MFISCKTIAENDDGRMSTVPKSVEWCIPSLAHDDDADDDS